MGSGALEFTDMACSPRAVKRTKAMKLSAPSVLGSEGKLGARISRPGRQVAGIAGEAHPVEICR